MNKLVQAAKKYKAVEMFKQFWRARVSLFAILELLLLGTSRTSLELLREIVKLKIQKKLKKRYSHILKKYPLEYTEQASQKIIWICWFQGLEHAPDIVKQCVASVRKHFRDYNIVIITSDNYRQYVEFPAIIEDRIAKKQITLTHLSDLLRLELLIKYGGIWIDSTVYTTSDYFPKEILDANLFLFQELKPGSNGHSLPISSWFIVSKPNHPILLATREMLYEYWRRNKKLIDYFLLHHFISISKEHFSDLWKDVPRYSNSIPHLLLLEFFNDYSENRLNEICRLTSLHKLSYKFTNEQLKKENTYFTNIFKINEEK
ncbi:capsular polysaccharide synthesis protein [Streptococcus pluranimalium]